MGKKVLAVVLLSIAFFLGAPYASPVLDAGSKVFAAMPAIENLSLQRDVRVYDALDPDFQLIMVVTGFYYSSMTGYPTGYNSGFTIYKVSGSTAVEIGSKCGCSGLTSPFDKVVIIISHSMTSEDESRIVSHELTHVLQTVHGVVFSLPKIESEYQAELVSRFTMSLIESASKPLGSGSLDTKQMNDEDLESLRMLLHRLGD
jgi:hypothetical protein